jgi:hypothetical protein
LGYPGHQFPPAILWALGPGARFLTCLGHPRDRLQKIQGGDTENKRWQISDSQVLTIYSQSSNLPSQLKEFKNHKKPKEKTKSSASLSHMKLSVFDSCQHGKPRLNYQETGYRQSQGTPITQPIRHGGDLIHEVKGAFTWYKGALLLRTG